jgi:MraZ protein
VFKGLFLHTIDAKGRVSIPAGIRMELQRRSQLAPTLTIRPDHLVLFAHEDFEAFAQRLLSVDALNPRGQELVRFFLGHSEEAGLDGQGRILIPGHMREHAKLDKDVVIVGAGNYVEIWDRRRHEEGEARTLARFDEISEEVSKLGRRDHA